MTTTEHPELAAGVTLGFSGYAPHEASDRVRAFEDDVLGLLGDHGARLLFRGHRQPGQPDDLPAEFHVLWFPSDGALDAYLSDPRRSDLLARHGDAFTSKVVVRLDPIT